MAGQEFDTEYDLVVVGSGASGKSAALIAARAGLNVAILEKEPTTGGTSVYAEAPAAFESSEQKARGVPHRGGKFPTKEEGLRRFLEFSHYRANSDVVRAFVENSAETIELYKSLGVEFYDVDIAAYDDPREVATFHLTEGKGAHLQEVLLAAVEKAGVDIFTATPVEELIVEGGAVTGVVARDADGGPLRVGAKAVILATGGMGNDLNLLATYSWFPHSATNFNVLTPLHNEGDGLKMALAVGADPDEIVTAPILAAGGRGMVMDSHVGAAGSQPGLWVNLGARRFVDEGVALALGYVGSALAKQLHATVISVFDEATVERLETEGSEISQGEFVLFGQKLSRLRADFDQAVADGVAWKGDTIEELAANAGLDPATLAATVAEYNALADAGADTMFFKPARFLRPLRTGPFYAVSMAPGVMASAGGIHVNGDMQVVDAEYRPIPGLYAVGLDAQGLYGDTYNMEVPGAANGFAHTSGRIAARHVVATLAPSQAD
jgi:fumarate reductase flavoprotein subunit